VRTLRILFVHEVSYLKKVIYEMHEFPELLSLKGHQIVFLEFDEGRKFWDKRTRSAETQVPGRVHKNATISLARPFQLGIPGLDRLLATVTVIPKLRHLLKHGSFDVVVLYAVPTYGFQTIKIARKSSTPVVFRALDVSHKIRSSILSPLIKAVERFVYRNSDLISANNLAMADYCKRLSARTKPSEVHYPPLDLEHFKSSGKDLGLAESLGISESDKVITYMGSFFYFSGLHAAVAEFARSSKPDQKFLLIGGGELEKELREQVSRLGLSGRVIFTGFVPYAELPRYLKLSDIAINTLERNLVADVALPNKVLQYVASGLSVVSTELAGLKSIFQNSGAITWADSPEQVMAKALHILSDKPTGQLRTSNVGEVLKAFEPSVSVSSFESALLNQVRGER
jgi:glycosyltransferase involved in cell wall biosynthesis